jgi:hypothetical protein
VADQVDGQEPSSTDLDWFFASSPSQYSGLEPGELVNNP